MHDVEFLAEQKNIVINNFIPPALVVQADSELIERVMVNILTNAIKHTPNNGLITLLAEQAPDDDSQVEVKIMDTGEGIPAEQLDKVFDKFTQASAKHSGTIRSTGLGLTFCKIAVEAHGGKIGARSLSEKINSEETTGTTLWFTLPLGDKQRKLIHQNEVVKKEKDKQASMLVLTASDVEILKPILQAFRQYEIYDISILRKLLKQLEGVENQSLKHWREEISKAISSGNDKRYKDLISQTEID
jgi:hypothetical protein